MADPAVRKLSYGANELVRYLGFVYLIGGVAGLFAALAGDTFNPLEFAVLGLFVAGGVPMALGRAGLIVDPAAGTLTKWWGVLVPFSRTAYALATIAHVRLSRQIRQTSKGAHVTHPVLLVRQHAGDVSLWDSYSYARARLRAEALAKLLQVDLHDETSGEAIVREARYLDEPLVERHRRLGAHAPLREPPPGAAGRIVSSGAGSPLVIEVPPGGFSAAHLAVPLVLCSGLLLIPLLLAYVSDDRGLMLLFGLLFAPALLAAAILAVNVATVREVITVSPAGIEIASRSWVRRTRKRIDAGAIEEIVPAAELRKGAAGAVTNAIAYSAGVRAVLVRTDHGVTGIGRWVSEAEQAWLRDALVHGLVGGTRFSGASPHAAAPDTASASPARRELWWLAGILASGVLALVGYESGLLRKITAKLWPGEPPPAARYAPAPSGYEFEPGPGSGYIRIYARGVRASRGERDVHVSLDEVHLLATSAQRQTRFGDLSVSIHQRAGQDWKLIGASAPGNARTSLGAGGAFTFAGPQTFVIRGAVDPCTREPCYFRVHILGQVGDGRPGWDVTTFRKLPLP